MNDLADALRRSLDRRRQTEREAALRLGISQAALNSLLKGETDPKLSTFVRLYEAYPLVRKVFSARVAEIHRRNLVVAEVEPVEQQLAS